VLVQVQTDASVGSITTGTTPKAKTVAQDLDTLAERAEAMDPSLTVQRSGNIDQEVGIGISAVELVGVAIAAIVLLITFGSLMAAGTPLIAAAVGVGVGMLGNPGIAARMFGALQKADVNIDIISTSEISISCLITKDKLKEAANAIHDEFFPRG